MNLDKPKSSWDAVLTLPSGRLKNLLNSAVMCDDIELIDVSSHPVAVEKGDRVVLASNGLLNLDEQEIAHILQQTQDATLADSAAALIQAVEEAEHPYQDNATVLLYAPAEGTELATTLNGPQEGKEGTNYE